MLQAMRQCLVLPVFGSGLKRRLIHEDGHQN
jgi:hypothetical protein